MEPSVILLYCISKNRVSVSLLDFEIRIVIPEKSQVNMERTNIDGNRIKREEKFKTSVTNLWRFFAKANVAVVLSFLLLFFIFVVNLYPPHFLDKYIADSFYGKFCSQLYESIRLCPAIGWFTLVVITLVAQYLGWKTVKERLISLGLIVSGLLAIWIASDSFWTYNSWVWKSDFRFWLVAAILSMMPWYIPSIYGVLIQFLSSKNESVGQTDSNGYSLKGFTTDELKADADPISVSYARAIGVWLKTTGNDHSAFAFGLEGKWGSGKSVMLGLIKNELPECVIMDFNPWLALSEKSLVRDFFDALAKTVAENVDSNLYTPIMRYGDAILALEGMGGWFDIVKNYFKSNDEASIKALKERIAGALKKKKTKIYIFLDDIDRLDSDEVFEIFRLVRNTADFPNLIYVAAYDRGYVVSQLDHKGIANAEQYIEKIFNIEVVLPGRRYEQLERELKIELKEMVPEEIPVNNLPVGMGRGVFYSFRDVKRFARQFSVTLMFVYEQVGLEECDLDDLFLLELIRYGHRDIYDLIKHKPRKIFKTPLSPEGVHVLEIKQEFKDTEKQKPRNSLYLLSELIEKSERTNGSFVYVNNYNRFLSFHLERDEITRAEFNLWLYGNEKVEDSLKPLIEKSKPHRSLLFQFSRCDISLLDDKVLKRYFEGLVLLFYLGRYHREEIEKIFLSKLGDNSLGLLSSSDFVLWLTSRLLAPVTPDWHRIAKICKGLRSDDIYHSGNVRLIETVNFRSYLDTVNPEPIEMLDLHSSVRVLYSNSIIWHEEGYETDDGDYEIESYGETPLIDVLEDFYSRYMRSFEERARFVRKLTTYETIDNHGNEYEDYYPDYMVEKEQRDIFGSVRNYQRFLNAAFESKPTTS